MYALIYDTHELDHAHKRIVSVHKSRETAERALEMRKKKLGKKIWECDTRIVWLTSRFKAGDTVTVKDFSNWRPGEPVFHGETHSDSD
jgi:hypothetical protein